MKSASWDSNISVVVEGRELSTGDYYKVGLVMLIYKNRRDLARKVPAEKGVITC